MPSPFPGMDPYLERPGEWAGLHADLIAQIKRELTPMLGGGYRAMSELMLFLHEPSAKRRRVGRADDAVGIAPSPPGAARATGGVASESSLRMSIGDPVDVEQHRYVEIRMGDGGRVVTVIELLSPTNKAKAEDRAVYLNKRSELIRADVHFLQIDLLRAGPRLLPEAAPPHDYNAMLVRADGRSEAEVWTWSLRDRIPILPVPLAEGDGEVTLDLRASFDATYDALDLGRFVYARPPRPPLSAEDAAWAAERLATIRP